MEITEVKTHQERGRDCLCCNIIMSDTDTCCKLMTSVELGKEGVIHYLLTEGL